MIVRDRPSGLKLFLLLRGSVLQQIRKVLLINVLLATVVTVLHGTVFSHKITLTAIPFTLIGLPAPWISGPLVAATIAVLAGLDTEVPLQMFRMACANMGAVGTMRMFLAARTGAGWQIESVMTSDFITDFSTRSTAGPDRTPWVM